MSLIVLLKEYLFDEKDMTYVFSLHIVSLMFG